MLHYSTTDQATMSKECSEIHTIQIFREASSCVPNSVSSDVIRQSPEIMTSSTLIPSQQNDLTYGIGGDWAIEMDEEMADIEEPPSTLDSSEKSNLYSFYFETPVVSMGHESGSDEYTITSTDTESFRGKNALDLDRIENIWEQGLDQTSAVTMESSPIDATGTSTECIRR